MSDYLVHFTKSEKTLCAILTSGCLRASGPFGYSFYRKLPEVTARHQSVCLSEIPLDQLHQLTKRHGQYGVGFTKDFVRSRQGARVWYVDEKSSQAANLSKQLEALRSTCDWTHPLWDLTPFIDLVMPSKGYVWDWEREWRVQNHLTFALADVAFVITPEGVDELPFEGIYWHPDYYPVVAASLSSLEQHVERLLEEFHQTFDDPANCLPVDGGEYVWIVDEWDTEDAVAYLFGDEQEVIQEELVDYLDGESTAWVRSSDMDFSDE
ncbi:MAG: abortive infection system antitoxin AbiGi family protein [Actinomycetota bacterium]|nr:abortive infection system antitoxin AbiGi family protein [Actinomycetota bacterium]